MTIRSVTEKQLDNCHVRNFLERVPLCACVYTEIFMLGWI